MSFSAELLDKIRNRFEQIDHCPVQGERIFFENAGGALTLKSVTATAARFAAIPDNQGRENAGSHELGRVIQKAKEDMRAFTNAPGGQFFVGESGTELLFRLIMNACLGTDGARVISSTLEHPATRSACDRWSKISRKQHVLIKHDDATGCISADAYAAAITADTAVATIIHTSPVTGMGVDLPACVSAIRKTAPDCFIIVDGIQHAAHGQIDLESYNIDGYVISPYKVFSRHGYGVAWISDRLTALPHDSLINGPEGNWELGTRDTGSYATLSDVVGYFDWLGGELIGSESDQRSRFIAAGKAIHAHEKDLTDTMLHGTGNLPGLHAMENVTVIGGIDNPAREGLVSLFVNGTASADVVEQLNQRGIRTHTRKADHYSGNILDPLGKDSCVRVSLCHYNSREEVSRFLSALLEIQG